MRCRISHVFERTDVGLHQPVLQSLVAVVKHVLTCPGGGGGGDGSVSCCC